MCLLDSSIESMLKQKIMKFAARKSDYLFSEKFFKEDSKADLAKDRNGNFYLDILRFYQFWLITCAVLNKKFMSHQNAASVDTWCSPI